MEMFATAVVVIGFVAFIAYKMGSRKQGSGPTDKGNDSQQQR